MSHTHEYRHWHAHGHRHVDESKGLGGWEPEDGGHYYYLRHGHGHYHDFAQTHEHGRKSSLAPHAHQARQAHPDEGYKQHHAAEGREKEA